MARLKPINLPEPRSDIYSSIDPLDSRYYDQETARYLSERTYVAYQAYVEAALAAALAEFDICSQPIAKEIEKATKKVTIEEKYKEEKVTNHEVKALVNSIKNHLSDEARPFVHFGATSYDIVSNAQTLQYKTTMQQLIIPRLKELLLTLVNLTEKYADTNQIGRTHGQHAVPITFGFAIAEYVSRLGENIVALNALTDELRGKFSGAVGAYNAVGMFVKNPEKFESTLLGYLGIKPAPYSTQIAPPEYLIRLIDELAITAGIMTNISHDMRHLQRTEIAEVREKFEKGQAGSSTMAHKRNPWNFENVISMSKQVTAQIINANLNIASEHQRDLTDSASSRFYPVVFAAVASTAKRLNKVMSKIEVDEENMQRNLHLTKGAIAAEPLYLLLEKHGHVAAHEKSKEISQTALERGVPLSEQIQIDKEAAGYWKKFTTDEKQIIKQPELAYTGIASKKAKSIAKKWKQWASNNHFK